MGLSVYDEHTRIWEGTTFDVSNGTATSHILTMSWEPGRIDQILLTSSDAIAHICSFTAVVQVGSTVLLGSVNLPAGTGYGGTPALDALPLLVGAGVGIVITGGDALDMNLDVAATVATVVGVLVVGGKV